MPAEGGGKGQGIGVVRGAVHGAALPDPMSDMGVRVGLWLTVYFDRVQDILDESGCGRIIDGTPVDGVRRIAPRAVALWLLLL